MQLLQHLTRGKSFWGFLAWWSGRTTNADIINDIDDIIRNDNSQGPQKVMQLYPLEQLLATQAICSFTYPRF